MSLLEPRLTTTIPWILDRGKNTPLHFGDPVAELALLQEHTALLDFSHRGSIALSGHERVDFLGGLVTNQVKNLTPTQSIYTTMLSPQGRFLWDFTLIDHGIEFFLDTEPDSVPDLKKSLEFYRMRSKVQIQDQSDHFAILGLVGPTAAASIARAFPDIAVSTAPLGTTWTLEGDIRLWRDPRHPDFGYRLQVPTSGFFDLWQRLRTTIPPAGHWAWEAYRILHALPRGGAEWTPGETLPLEAGALEMNAVSFQKGCYVGQETTARTHHRGTLKKRLFHVTMESHEGIPPGTQILLPSGKEVGIVTSSSLVDGKVRGLAVLRVGDITSDASLTALGVAVSVQRPRWATWE